MNKILYLNPQILLLIMLLPVMVYPFNGGGDIENGNSFKSLNYNSRSDSIDVLHYHLNLDIKNFSAQTISGYTEVTIHPKINGINVLHLDLLKMTIDSIIENGQILSFTYNDTLLKVNLGSTYGINDTIKVKVAYHGIPEVDAIFGGFDFNGVYAYNLGVGFEADPHVFGRAWHPCFDNFVERATYSFQINTDSLYTALCNGEKTNVIANADGSNSWFWNLDKEIPSYLACVAVSKYAVVHQTFTGINGNVPVELGALPADTTAMKSAFIHLENAFDAFEAHFGPYQWNKVGYSLVPFSGGAMEHATNIAYPQAFIPNGIIYEAELMSHELSHHWFGNLVTCKTAEEMWLNEGFASFSAFVFTESLNGYQAYKNAVRANHAKILQFTHLKEGGYRPVSDIPQQYTYGDHVYLKGADMAHTIRGYMGDTKFFQGIKDYLANNAFKDVTSATLRDELAASSGLNLNDCFDNWIFGPGYAHFSIDSFTVQPVGSQFQVQVYVRQKLTGAPTLFTNVPLEITFKNNAFASFTDTIMVSGQYSNSSFNLPFNPTYAGINLEAKISDAIVSEYKMIKTTGTNNFTDSKFNFTCTAITDSAFVRVEHNFTAPDGAIANTGYILSPNRYFKIDGIFPASFKATASFPYNGINISNYSGSYQLDNLLFTPGYNEDSLVLLYRSSAKNPWTLFPYYTMNIGNHTDKIGTVKIDSLKIGEYVLAMKNNPNGIISNDNNNSVILKPNPANDIVEINLNYRIDEQDLLTVIDINGKIIQQLNIKSQKNISLNVANYANGIYYLVFSGNQKIITKQLVVTH